MASSPIVQAGLFLNTPRTNLTGFMSLDGYNGEIDSDIEKFATTVIATHEHSATQVEWWWAKIMEIR